MPELKIEPSRRKRLSHQLRTDIRFQAVGIAYRSEMLARDIDLILAHLYGSSENARKHPLFDLAVVLREVGATTSFHP